LLPSASEERSTHGEPICFSTSTSQRTHSCHSGTRIHAGADLHCQTAS
jgi:hypothetical protein